MTIQEELEIYQRMLRAFRKQYWRPFKFEFAGFCSYLFYKTKFKKLDESTILISLKPIDPYSCGYWFDPRKMSPRIKLLKKAIKICKQQLKSEKYVENI